MPTTNHPQGLSSFGFPLIGSGPYLTAGKVFWVNSALGVNAAGRGEDPKTPFDSLDYAIGKCSAGRGDFIFLMPGHTETVATPSAITVDIAGITIVGLGQGSLRPTFNFTATDSTIVVSAANVVIENCYFDLTGIDAVVTGFGISGADCTIKNCHFLMADSGGQAVKAIAPLTGADRLKILGCDFIATNAGATAAILGIVAVDRLEVGHCYFEGNFTVAAINNTTVAWTLCWLHHNRYNGLDASEPIIELLTGATGQIAYNLTSCATFSAGGSIVADAAFKFENYITDTAANSGILDPVGVTL